MASQAQIKFHELIKRAALLSGQAGKFRRSQDSEAKAVFLHAALTTQVAAWDVYIKALVIEYFSVITNIPDVRYMALHDLCQQAMERAEKKLNTPNSENSRTFFIQHTGFDPWPSWSPINFGLITFSSSLLVRERLDEVLKLRHSFAHGSAMPLYSWNGNTTGSAQLTCATVKITGKFFTDICMKTDVAMATHISFQHGIPKPW